MKKGYAFLLALLITLVFLGNFLFFHAASNERENVIIARVIDGDTVQLEDGRTVRLVNINTPEKGTPGSKEAYEYLAQYINKSVEMENKGTEKYGRTLGKIYYVEDYLNWQIVRNGLGNTFLTNDEETKEFSRAQHIAVEEGLGIWKHSPYYGCAQMTINIKDEYVDFNVACNVSLQDWELGDESRKRYVFSDIKQKRFRVYSASGRDSETEKFWNVGNVWNDDRDTATLKDDTGLLVDFYSYGY